MCTLVVFHEPTLAFPVLVAANRDELLGRETRPFGRHWPGEPWQGGLDVSGGGTWAGLHDAGFGVFILNQRDALGPSPGKRSRGLLAVDLLKTGSPAAAAELAGALSPEDYRGFHAVITSPDGVTDASWSPDGVVVTKVEPGLSIWTASGRNRSDSGRQVAHRPTLEKLGERWRSAGDVKVTLAELETTMGLPAPEGSGPADALCIRLPEHDFGTRSSLLIALPTVGSGRPVLVRYADGPPDETPFRRITVAAR